MFLGQSYTVKHTSTLANMQVMHTRCQLDRHMTGYGVTLQWQVGEGVAKPTRGAGTTWIMVQAQLLIDPP